MKIRMRATTVPIAPPPSSYSLQHVWNASSEKRLEPAEEGEERLKVKESFVGSRNSSVEGSKPEAEESMVACKRNDGKGGGDAREQRRQGAASASTISLSPSRIEGGRLPLPEQVLVKARSGRTRLRRRGRRRSRRRRRRRAMMVTTGRRASSTATMVWGQDARGAREQLGDMKTPPSIPLVVMVVMEVDVHECECALSKVSLSLSLSLSDSQMKVL